MKSIFKKIALVLALAMIVTMLPAKNASVAAADASANKWVRKTCTLYIDALADDAIYVPAAYATAKTKVKVAKDAEDGWKTLGYSVSFASADENVATVDQRYGLVEARGIGQTTITATFTKEGTATITESFPVTVKRCATSVALDEGTEKAVNSLMAGNDSVALKAVMTDADGNAELVGKVGTGKLAETLKERKYVTDYLKFEVKNPEGKEVLKYDAEKNELTAVAAGEASIKVIAYRYDWKSGVKANKGYTKTRTATKDYTVTVKEAGILSVKQLSTTKVAITCGNTATAEAIAKDPSKLTATYTLNDNKITTYIKSAAVDSTDNKMVVVELYTAMNKDVTYNFTYNEKTVSLVGVDPDAITAIRIVTTQAKVETDTPIVVEFLNADGVVINAGPNALTFSAADETSSDYYVDGSGSIYFFTAGKTATVKATYDMGYDQNGNKIPDLTASAVIVSKVASDSDTVTGYGVVNANDAASKWASEVTYTTGVLNLVKDNSVQLYVKYTVKNYNGSTSTYYNKSFNTSEIEADNGSKFTFKYVSTNDAVVFVDETEGVLYPVSAGSAQIIVYRVVGDKEAVVGAVAIKVEASRIFATFKGTLSSNKLSTQKTIRINVDAKDQLGASLSGDVSYQAKLVNTSDSVTVKLKKGTSEIALTKDFANVDGLLVNDNGNYFFEVEATNAPTTATPVKISLQVTYGNVNKTITLSLNAKAVDPTATNNLTYSLDLGDDGASIDLNLPQATSWWKKLHSTIEVNVYDSAGYFVRTEAMSNTKEPEAGKFGFTVTKNGTEIYMGAGEATKWTFSPMVVSGSAITMPMVGKDGKEFDTPDKLKGTYVIKVVQGVTSSSVKVYKPIAVKNIVVQDSTVKPVVTVSSTTTTATDRVGMAAFLESMRVDGKLVITRAGSNISSRLEIIDADVSGNTSGRVYVKKITVRETLHCDGSAAQWNSLHGKTYTYTIDINKVFYNN